MLWKKKQSASEKNNGIDYFQNWMPDELIILILNFLNNPQELAKLGEVSTLFYRLASDNALWKQFLHAEPRNSISTTTSKKAIFVTHPEKILPQYSCFAPLTYQLQMTKKLLYELKENEEFNGRFDRAEPLAAQLEAKFEKVRKDKRIDKIKKLFPGLFNTKPKYDSKQLQQAVHAVNAFRLELLSAVIAKINEMKAGMLLDVGYELSWFNSVLINLAKRHGNNAAILAPGCLEKLLDYINTKPHPAKLLILSFVLAHEQLVTNPDLPQLMDGIIDRIKQPSMMNVIVDPAQFHEIIVKDVLADREKMVNSIPKLM